MTGIFYYRGQVRPYLQGNFALKVVHQQQGYLSCYLGSERSRIRLRDFRSQVYKAAQQVADGKSVETFAGVFGQPAQVKIRLERGKVRIDLYDDPETVHKAPLLWLGVIKNDEPIPLTTTRWKIFRAISKTRTGFALLLQNLP